MAAKEQTYGLEEVWKPEDAEPEIDIVAVHGLNGDARRTWTAPRRQISWLRHPDFLPKHVPNARILVWGYNASFSSIGGAEPSKNRIHQHAHTLVANLSADRRLAGTTNKPLVFLCHSLGGIIVKRALSYAQTRTSCKVSHEYNIFASTHAILFFGTPHAGSAKATYLKFLLKVLCAAGQGSPTGFKSDLVSALEQDSETLQNITDYFVPLMKNYRIFFFWEEEKTDLRIMGRDVIVTSDSAAPAFDDTERAGLPATHSGMVKFEDPSDQGFRMVVEALMRYCEEAPPVIAQRLAFAQEFLDWERRKETMELMRHSHNVQGSSQYRY